MWLVAYFVLLLFAWYQSFFWSPLHLYILFSAVYVLIYTLNARERDWHWFRSLSFWDRFRKWYFPHHVHSSHWNSFTADKLLGCAVFVVIDNGSSSSSLMRSLVVFGLHGSKNPLIQRLDPLIVAPSYLFYLPYVTDVIQWAGMTSLAPEDHVVNGRSVVIHCHCPLDAIHWASKHAFAVFSLIPVIHVEQEERRCLSSCSPLPRELHTLVGKPVPVVAESQIMLEAFQFQLDSLVSASAAVFSHQAIDIELGIQ